MARSNSLKKTVTVDGVQATFVFIERDQPRWIPPRSSNRWDRGHMSCTQQDYTKKPRVYVDTAGESLLDNLANRTTRPVTVWGRAVRKAMAALELVGKLGWSQRAGCAMCPCSPGFIWTNAPAIAFEEGGAAHTRYDAWVTLEGTPVVRDDAQARALQAARAAAVSADPTLPDLSKVVL